MAILLPVSAVPKSSHLQSAKAYSNCRRHASNWQTFVTASATRKGARRPHKDMSADRGRHVGLTIAATPTPQDQDRYDHFVRASQRSAAKPRFDQPTDDCGNIKLISPGQRLQDRTTTSLLALSHSVKLPTLRRYLAVITMDVRLLHVTPQCRHRSTLSPGLRQDGTRCARPA